jgi:hypothetical protein
MIMDLGSVITWVTANIDIIAQIVGVFALLATLTPNESDNAIVDAILKGVNFFGANVAKAGNHQDTVVVKEAPPAS